MPVLDAPPDIPLPKGWPKRVKSAVLHVISLAQYALASARGWAADCRNVHARRSSEADRMDGEIALLREEIRIKDARMARIKARRRPHYPPIVRMSILELKAARGWSQAEVARRFLVESATIASWLRCVDEKGAESLVQISEPVNRFPDFVRHVVRRLKVLCPSLGKVKIAGILARAGLHLAPSTVGRMIHDRSPRKPAKPAMQELKSDLVVTAKRPNHVHHVDLTVVPTSMGLWTAWFPFALPQVWPFCWWLAVVLDHFSRRAVGVAVFRSQPSSEKVRTFLGRIFASSKPKYLLCDKGGQFWCEAFKDWCKRIGVKLRFGAVGKYGSISVLERFIRTLKDEGIRWIVVPFRREALRREVDLQVVWYNASRPHMALGGRTPDEVWFGLSPANEAPRIETRLQWPRDALCAAPYTSIRGRRGQKVELVVRFHAGRKHLPIVELKKVA